MHQLETGLTSRVKIIQEHDQTGIFSQSHQGCCNCIKQTLARLSYLNIELRSHWLIHRYEFGNYFSQIV